MSKVKRKCYKCYNKQDKTCCNRTGTSWAKILLYHILFICTIMGMLLLVIFQLKRTYRENPDYPAVKKLVFVGDTGPGATLVPNVDELPVILYSPNSTNEQKYSKAISTYIEKQKEVCRFIYQTTGRICRFNVTEFGPCAKYPYGYDQGKPCIILKLNKIPTWAPEKYATKENVPKNTGININPTKSIIHISCEPLHPYDNDVLGKIKFYPEQFFGDRYFPMPKDISTNPAIAIQLEVIQYNILGTLRCRMYAKNIKNFNTRMYFYLH